MKIGVIDIEITVKNLKINYLKQGEGRNVIILPGWGTTIAVYKTLVDSISTYAKVYTLDMPGFGESEEPKQSWNVDDFVDFIIEFIEKNNITDFDIIGHSNGGRIIIKLLNRKDLKFNIGKVVLIGSAGIVHEKTLSQKIKIKTFKIGKKVLNTSIIKKAFPNAITNFQNKHGSDDYRNASPIMKETMVKLVNEDLRNLLPNISNPTLLIWGENDDATPIEDAEIMEKNMKDAGLVRIKNCTHYVFLEQVEYVNKIINTFFTGGK